jgi:HSP20 family protein
MAIHDLIPWNKNNRGLAMRRSATDPFNSLHREIDRVFDDFMADWPGRMSLMSRPLEQFMPAVEIKEIDKEFRITAELPGMEEKDLEVMYADGGLTIKGEKQKEHTEEEGNYYHSECQYGTFERMIPLPAEVNPDKAKASFKNGVLKITLPKTEEARSHKKTISIGS